MSRARRTLPDKPPLALRPAGACGDRPYTASTPCNLASIRSWSSTSTTTSEDAPRPSVSHAHTGQFATLAGIAVISLAGNSKAARRSAQRGILAGPWLTPLFSTTERSHQSAAYACATAGEAARFRSSEFAAAAAPASTGLAADRRDLRARPEQPRAGFGLHGAIAIDGLGGYGRGRARVRAYMPIYCVSRASSKSHRAKYSSRPWPRRN